MDLSYMQNCTEKLHEYLQLVEASLLNVHKAEGRDTYNMRQILLA